MTYAEKFKDPRWQRKRLEIFQRDEFTCQSCISRDKTLNVHHAFYTGYGVDPWDYPNEILFTLCDDCHAKEEELKKKDPYLLVAHLGITRKDMLTLVDHIVYAMRDAQRDSMGGVAFSMRVLHQIVPVDEFKDFIKWRDESGWEAQEGKKNG